MAGLIPVRAKPEPEAFDRNVRQPGLAWLRERDIDFGSRQPANTSLFPFWRACLDELHRLYDGVCAYLCVYLERESGSATVDHFVPKSQQVRLAYEWSNYRLASHKMNGKKGIVDDVLDPFELDEGTFCLDLVTGRIYVNPGVVSPMRERAQTTIDRLGLDRTENRNMRLLHFQQYQDYGRPEQFLREYSPFVWAEARRQGLL